MVSCTPVKRLETPSNIVRCLRTTLLPDADPGGWWVLYQQPQGSTPIIFPPKGAAGADNPCLDLNWCGQYKFKYYVESTTCINCIDSSALLTVNYTFTITGYTTCTN